MARHTMAVWGLRAAFVGNIGPGEVAGRLASNSACGPFSWSVFHSPRCCGFGQRRRWYVFGAEGVASPSWRSWGWAARAWNSWPVPPLASCGLTRRGLHRRATHVLPRAVAANRQSPRPAPTCRVAHNFDIARYQQRVAAAPFWRAVAARPRGDGHLARSSSEGSRDACARAAAPLLVDRGPGLFWGARRATHGLVPRAASARGATSARARARAGGLFHRTLWRHMSECHACTDFPASAR